MIRFCRESSAAGQIAGRDLDDQALASTRPCLRSGSEHQGAAEPGQPARQHTPNAPVTDALAGQRDRATANHT